MKIWTDGSCIDNPGPGGWAVVIQHADAATETYSGGMVETTNNQMEIMACIQALHLTEAYADADVIIHTDSQYVVNGITRWITKWQSNGWQTSDRKPVKNADLWQALDRLRTGRRVTWEWVRGHSGDPMNERADRLALESAKLRADRMTAHDR